MADVGSIGGIQGGLGLGKDKGAKEAEGPSFGDIMKSTMGDAVETMHESEKVSAAALTGDADLTEVLSALTNAEMALNTVIAVRDRVISAYQEIMRMPI